MLTTESAATNDSNGGSPPTNSGVTNARNITVIPHIEGSGEACQLKPRSEVRYQRVKLLGSGAMGEVSLVRDRDIGRTVAIKQIIGQSHGAASVARFVHEIRTIGQLEHPNIVPVYDVGADEQGQLYFVMKHIDGETLENIISRLEAGDPDYLERYTTEYRVEIFLGLLHALQFAHARGIVHLGCRH